MKWRILLFVCLICSRVSGQVMVTQYQYWYDNNFAGNVLLPVSPAAQIQFSASIPTATLAPGLHVLNSRFLQSDGKYSLVTSRFFMRVPSGSGTGKSINLIEYWFDDNYGSKTVQPLSTTGHYNGTLSLIPGTLNNGLHSVHVRFRDNSNVWSTAITRYFMKTTAGADSANLVTAYEYWFDNDYGGRVSQATTGNAGIHLITAINATALLPGLHTVHTRFKDSRNLWSTTHNRFFMKAPSSIAGIDSNVVTAFRYWIDTAFHQAKRISLSAPSRIATITSTLPIAYLDTGRHLVYIQFQDTAKNWSSVLVDSFRQMGVIPPGISLTLADSVFCAGNAVPVSITLHKTYSASNLFTVQLSNEAGSFSSPLNLGSLSGSNAGTINATIPPGTASGSDYRIRVISTAPVDTSAISMNPITIKRIPDQVFAASGATITCAGNQGYNIPLAQTGVNYSWQLTGGGTITPSGTSASVLWHTTGHYLLTVAASNSCGSGFVDSLYVQVMSVPPVMAPVAHVSGTLLQASALVTDATGYQWFYNSNPIPGATSITYNASVSGTYTVAYTNPCGAGTQSDAINVIIRQNQVINLPAISDKVWGDAPFTISAGSSSSLPVTLSIDSGPATISGDTITITGGGTVVVAATQPGDATYFPASTVFRSFTVNKAAQSVIFQPVADRNYGDPPFSVTATSSTGFPLIFSVVSGNATVTDNMVRLTGAGTVTLRATQPGNQNYRSAFADRTFCIGARQPDTIYGFSTSCVSSQLYYTDSVPGTIYTWSVSGPGTLSSTSGGATSVTWNATGNGVVSVSAASGCNSSPFAKALNVVISNPQFPAVINHLFPADSVTVPSFPMLFSWAPVAGAQVYDLYIWADGSATPSLPLFANISQIGKTVFSNSLPGFTAGKRYHWKVIARSTCNQLSSMARTFRIAQLPDLLVDAIAAPDTVFSGQNIAIALTVRNAGHAATNTSWYDAVYLSADSLIDQGTDAQLNMSFNLTALDTLQTYTRNINVTLPATTVGTNYIIARTNNYLSQAETDVNNNLFVKPIYINQSPVPDLKVTSVITSGNTFSGQTLSVTWQVKNQGGGNTASVAWQDHIYLSPDSAFDINTSLKADQFIRSQAILYRDSSYVASKVIRIPDQLFGRYYVFIVTDANNSVYESAFENNNVGRSDAVTIYLTPPPDFTIANFNAPTVASRGETVMVDWTTRNTGAARQLKDSVWTDKLYFSADSTLTTSNLTNAATVDPPKMLHPLCSQHVLGTGGCRYISPLMDAEDVYYNTHLVTLPATADSIYLHLRTDDPNRIFEYSYENNNGAAVKIKFINTDLLVPSIHAPANAAAGTLINIDWTVYNNGPGKMIARSRRDRLYWSGTSVFNTNTARVLAAFDYTGSLDSGSAVTNYQQVRIPDSLSGAIYLFVVADDDNQVYETNNNNNISPAAVVQVTMTPLPDLIVTQVSVLPVVFNAAQKVEITYTVKNQGTGNLFGKTWQDKIFLSRYPAWNADSAKLVYTGTATLSLFPDSTYTVADSVFISTDMLRQLRIDSTLCYFFVWTDAGNTVFEYTAEGNNITRSNPVTGLLPARPDLMVVTVSSQDSLQAGSGGTISWTVRNIGGKTDHYSPNWRDRIYLSTDTVFDSGDALLREIDIAGPLDTGRQYNRTVGFTVPNGLSGSYYLLAVTDASDLTKDRDRLNNYKVARDMAGVIKKIHVATTPPPDLVIETFDMPSIGYSGQPTVVKWKVKNQSAHPTPAVGWGDAFYLSTDTVLNTGTDILLGSRNHIGPLSAGNSYSDSLQLFMPITVQGNYYVLLKTDINNSIYETDEGNNVQQALTYIIKPLPADLVVSNVMADTLAMAGDTASVSWVVTNIGANPATGYMRQGVYLSVDTMLSNNDALLNDPAFTVALLPGDTMHCSTRFRVKDVSFGYYYPIVRTDLLDNIPEQNESNNATASASRIKVTTLLLPVDTTRYNVLKNNQELYYRIEIPDSLQGATLSVSLKADSLNGANQLYLRHDTMTTRASYDFVSTEVGGNQEVVIPSVEKGTYYLLVYGATPVAAHQQAISLFARKIDFSITDVNGKEGGNTGNVTIRIRGAKFMPGMIARLHDNILGTISTTSIYLANSTTVYATFNLSGAAVGTYDVRLVKPGIDSVYASDAFTITTGSGGVAGGGSGNSGSNGFYCRIVNTGVDGNLGTDVQHPAASAPNRTFPMTIIYGNSGNVDIPVATRALICRSGHPISLTSGRLHEKKNELHMEFKEVNGPPAVLRPGAVGYITVFTSSLSGGIMDFVLVE